MNVILKQCIGIHTFKTEMLSKLLPICLYLIKRTNTYTLYNYTFSSPMLCAYYDHIVSRNYLSTSYSGSYMICENDNNYGISILCSTISNLTSIILKICTFVHCLFCNSMAHYTICSVNHNTNTMQHIHIKHSVHTSYILLGFSVDHKTFLVTLADGFVDNVHVSYVWMDQLNIPVGSMNKFHKHNPYKPG